jgi:pyruvate dehydrogenase E2 component (dihydrolipoamide acetyltransferase)
VAKEFKLPDLGEGVETGDVVSVLVSQGDAIQVDQGVIELETDKALIEVPSESAGTVASVNVSVGDSIPPGTVLITVEETGGGSSPDPAVEEKESAPEAPTAPEPEPEAPAPASSLVADVPSTPAPVETPAPAPAPPAPGEAIPAAPATRRFARELGVDLTGVPGSGPGGRIGKEDVENHVRGVMAGGGAATPSRGPAPELPDFSRWGSIERQPMPKIRQVIAQNLTQAWTQIPHVTQFGSADGTDLEAFRQRNKAAAEARGTKLTPTVLVLKAIVTALKAFPQFNASLDANANEVIIKHYINLGIAVDTERGLLVPVIKDVDRKDIYELAAELGDLGDRTRNNRVTPDELQGGTFSVTNLGSLGGSAFTPIVNHPEVAILGIGRGREEAVVVDGRIEPRIMMPLCLSYDHRVVDGADGVRFINKLIESIQNPEHMLLGG